MGSTYKTLETWIAEVLAETDRKLTSLECIYEKQSGGTEECYSEPTEGKSWDPDHLFRVFKGRAEHLVQDRPGIHNFEMRAYFDKKPGPGAKHHFIVSDGEIRQGGAGTRVVERANTEGVISQLMRGLESALTINADLVRTMASTWAVERHSVQTYVSQLQLEVNDAYSVAREARMRDQTGLHQLEMERLKYQRESAERTLLLKQAPTMVAMARGQEVPGTVDTDIVEGLAMSVSDEDVETFVMMGKITREKADALKMRMAQARAKAAKEADEARRLPAGGTADVTNVTAIETARKRGGESL